VLENRTRLRRILKGNDLNDFQESLSKIKVWMTSEQLSEAKRMVIFDHSICGCGFMLPYSLQPCYPTGLQSI
jgi:hypothetical protein